MQLCDLFPTLSIKHRIGRYARLETLVTRPDASNRLSHVTWVFRITLRSSVSKNLCFGISTPCRNVSFASAIPNLHNIIKRFRETGEISVRKEQGRRPLLDARSLRALRRHCITHWHDSVIDITKWAHDYFQKPLSVNTILRAICRCQLKLYHAKKEAICEHGPEAPSCSVGQGSFKMDCFKVEKYSMVRRVQIWRIIKRKIRQDDHKLFSS